MNELAIHAHHPDRKVSPGTVVVILPQHVEQYWPAVEGMLRIVEGWTQVLAADDIHLGLLSGHMQLWTAPAPVPKLVFALTRIAKSARGAICSLWLIATHQSDDSTVAAIIDRCEAVARSEGCIALEINALPLLAERITGKVTAVIVERDLRRMGNEVN